MTKASQGRKSRAPVPSPKQLRETLGRNLRQLSSGAQSVSALCRDLGINRTQYNRYLSGESFPRPDVLHRICSYFGADARIILEPLESINTGGTTILSHPEIADFLSPGVANLPESVFPSGFYQFVRRSFMDQSQFVRGLIYVYRVDGLAFLRGLEAKDALIQIGMEPTIANREFRGLLMAQEGGVAALVSRKNTLSASFNFLSQVPSFENNHWAGYTVRTAIESSTTQRITRLVYEHLGTNTGRILAAARRTGYAKLEDLIPYQKNHLHTDEPFR